MFPLNAFTNKMELTYYQQKDQLSLKKSSTSHTIDYLAILPDMLQLLLP